MKNKKLILNWLSIIGHGYLMLFQQTKNNTQEF